MMFIGRDNSYLFYNLPLSQNPFIVCLFWLIHLMAFYTSATAILIVFGNDLLRWIRIMTSKISDVDLIFGINPDSLVFGRNITGKKRRMLVYVDSVIGEDYEASIRDIGGLTYSGNDAVKATPLFIKKLRIKPYKTRLRLYALSHEYDKNLQYV